MAWTASLQSDIADTFSLMEGCATPDNFDRGLGFRVWNPEEEAEAVNEYKRVRRAKLTPAVASAEKAALRDRMRDLRASLSPAALAERREKNRIRMAIARATKKKVA